MASYPGARDKKIQESTEYFASTGKEYFFFYYYYFQRVVCFYLVFRDSPASDGFPYTNKINGCLDFPSYLLYSISIQNRN